MICSTFTCIPLAQEVNLFFVDARREGPLLCKKKKESYGDCVAKLVHSCSKSLAVSHPGKTKPFFIEVFIPIEGTLPPKSVMLFPLSIGACSRRSAVCIMSPVRGELCTCSHAGGHAHLLPPCLPRFYTRKACICQLSRGNLHSFWKKLPEHAPPLFFGFFFGVLSNRRSDA